MRVLFMGTPDFAVPSLEAVVHAGYEVCGVFTQPDRPKNRGMKLIAPPVKQKAQELGIPVYQPEKLRDGTAQKIIQELAPELIVVAAYGRILPDEILDFPRLGCINVHSSLLPKYRGAAPIHWAMLNGEEETGVTIMHMASELDAGDIIMQEKTRIDKDETVETLYSRLAEIGGELLLKAVSALEAGTAPRISQDPNQVSYAPMLSRELSPIDWNKSAWEIHNQIRALIPWPAASTDLLPEQTMKVFSSRIGDTTQKAPGSILEAGKAGIAVACGDGKVLYLTEIQAPGSRRMLAADYLRGHPIQLS